MEPNNDSFEQDTLMYPLLEDLLKKIPSKFEVVVLASLRARQIIQKQRQGLSFERELDAEATSREDVPKPLSRALAEIAEGKLDRDKMYLLEYLEGFHRGDATLSVPLPPEEPETEGIETALDETTASESAKADELTEDKSGANEDFTQSEQPSEE